MAKKGTKRAVRRTAEELVFEISRDEQTECSGFQFFLFLVHGRLVSPCPSGADRRKANDEVRG
jgi:hypothetical protein